MGAFLLPQYIFAKTLDQNQNDNSTVSNQAGLTPPSNAQPDEFMQARVTKVLTKDDKDYIQSSEIVQKIRVKILDGKDKNKEVAAENNITSGATSQQLLAVGSTVVLVKSQQSDGMHFFVVDRYRISALWVILAIFLIIVIALSRVQGIFSLLGLLVSIGILFKFIVPQIFYGKDPLSTILIGVFLISVISIYMAHGIKKRTSIAIVGTLITLSLSVGLSVFFVHIASLFGTGTEDSLYLQLSDSQTINLRGLLLGGIIIGTLGILNDITTAQAATVDEIKKANPLLGIRELYMRGLSVGKEHISSLINTLALAYAGTSLPLFLLFFINKGEPLWVLVNSENISEEIVRTLVGSIALILAVPITTFLAAYFFGRVGHKDTTK